MEISQYQEDFTSFLKEKKWVKEPKNLYEPVEYILSLGGKKLRPLLTLMACDAFNSSHKEALPAALAVEVFHNFTLLHDDIMDEAPLRRGKQTVHEKWNINTGILSGDAMLILAYQFLEAYPPEMFHKLTKLFSKTAIEVCEGQQLDIDFETRKDVTIDEYLKMIRLKTAVLTAAALKMGAIIGGASEIETKSIYTFGENLGIAFQLQDDYLDTFGDPKTFGKQIGGDIIENKKTYLYLKTMELANSVDKEKMTFFYNQKLSENSIKINEVTRVFEKYDVPEIMRSLIEDYTQTAYKSLETLQISDSKKNDLQAIGEYLLVRNI